MADIKTTVIEGRKAELLNNLEVATNDENIKDTALFDSFASKLTDTMEKVDDICKDMTEKQVNEYFDTWNTQLRLACARCHIHLNIR